MRHIQIVSLIFLCTTLCVDLWGMGDDNQLKKHPRLFLDNQCVEELKKQTDEVSVSLKEITIQIADEALRLPPMVYPMKTFQILGIMRECQRRVLALSMAYLLTNQEIYFVEAKKLLMQLSALDDWGTGHFLDVGEATLAAGVGLDWLYHKLSEEERLIIIQAIITNSLRPALTMHESDNDSSWVNGTFNWNPVCHGGTVVGALAVADVDPQLSKRIIDRAVKNLPVYSNSFEPDGADVESPSYWSYGATFYAIAIEALRTATGSAYGLDKYQGFLKSGDFKKQVVGATGFEFNYSDYHAPELNNPVILWFGRELNRYDLVEQEIKGVQIALEQLKMKETVAQQTKKRFLSRHIPFALVWWNPELSAGEKSVAPLHYTALGGLPLGITRSSWTDSRASFVAIKGGTPNQSHGHMDVGSFILEAKGQRWAVDLGTESYDKMRAAKLDLWNYSQQSSRWTTFRVGPEAHNILRFDGEQQNINGHATIESLTLIDGSKGHRVDLTSFYVGKAKAVHRSVLLHPDGNISISDEWTPTGNAKTVTFQWLTYAEVVRTAGGLNLTQQGEALEISIAPSNVKIKIEDVSESKNIQDSPNLGLKRIVLEIPAGNTYGKLYVKSKIK